MTNLSSWISPYWQVFLLFVIPIGGGIPGGVLLAQAKGFAWPTMMFLYFLSDVLLAIVFEPILHRLIRLAKHVAWVKKLGEAFLFTIHRTIKTYRGQKSVLALIGVAFGVDPMTGRAVALAAGHGFFKGWAIAIAGDMVYFSVLMVSTLWLNHILGDGFWTIMIILILMVVIPHFVQKWQDRKSSH